jgi:hypothetical protein
MTEKEWLSAKAPQPLWYSKFARGDRKRRLAACACARRVLPILDHDRRAIELVDAIERFAECRSADRATAWRAVVAARARVRAWLHSRWPAASPMRRSDALNAVYRSSDATASRLAEMFDFAKFALRGRSITPGITEAPAQAAILRDIFGNPFRPVNFVPDWRTTTTVALAKQMYDSRDFGAMPILADALQDAGCDSDDALTHCRDAKGIHVRGCWVVDLVLGKS